MPDLTIKEAAAELRMSVVMLRRHVRLGTIRCVVKGFGQKRRHVVFTQKDLDEFRQRRSAMGSAAPQRRGRPSSNNSLR